MTIEYIKKDTKIKTTLYCKNDKEGFDVLSREAFKNKNREIHYPFSRNGAQKYKYIKSIEFKDVLAKEISGVYKAFNFGLGFTKNLSPIIYRLEQLPSIKKIVISSKLKSGITRNIATFNTVDLKDIFETIKPLKNTQSEELRSTSHNALSKIYPLKFKKSGQKYIGGRLSVFIRDNVYDTSTLSSTDIDSIVKLIPREIAEDKILFKAQEKINFVKLNKIKSKLERIVNQKTESKSFEGRCHKFLAENAWIFSNILSMPIVLMKSKAYVGGKSFDNSSGREADFLYRNKLTKNVFIFEIKTPLKKLFDAKTPYRKPDVFSLSKELTGGLVQLLDQRDNLQKEFYKLSKGKFESFNPRAVLLIGNLSKIKSEQYKSFELFRNNTMNVEIITFDELLEKTNLILGEFIESK